MIDYFKYEDLKEVEDLTPEGWPPITPIFKFYIESDFCTPLKFVKNNKMVGLGAIIFHERTVWLAHIVVHQDYRKQGIGGNITKALIEMNGKQKVATQSLIATELGYPVYVKQGFEIDTEYIFFKKGDHFSNPDISSQIIPSENQFRENILQLDEWVSGERRVKVLSKYMKTAKVFYNKNHLEGAYFPDFGDGLIIADNPLAGTELMKLRILEKDHAMLPVDNLEGIQLLKENGFIQKNQVKRLYLGKKLSWKPELLFNRIGGYLG